MCCCFWLDFDDVDPGGFEASCQLISSEGKNSMFLASKLVRFCEQFPGVVLSSGVSFCNFG